MPSTVMFRMMCSAVGKGTVILSNQSKSASDIGTVSVITDPHQVPELAALMAGGPNSPDGSTSASSCKNEWKGSDTIDFFSTYYQFYRYDKNPLNLPPSHLDCFWNQSEATKNALKVCSTLEAAARNEKFDLGANTLSGKPYIFKGCLEP